MGSAIKPAVIAVSCSICKLAVIAIGEPAVIAVSCAISKPAVIAVGEKAVSAVGEPAVSAVSEQAASCQCNQYVCYKLSCSEMRMEEGYFFLLLLLQNA